MTLGGAAATAKALAPNQTTQSSCRIRDIARKFITGKICDLNALYYVTRSAL
jgi:hypothetical protein